MPKRKRETRTTTSKSKTKKLKVVEGASHEGEEEAYQSKMLSTTKGELFEEEEKGLTEAAVMEDPFKTHFEQDLSEDEVDKLAQVLAKPLSYSHSKDAVLGGVGSAECLPERFTQSLEIRHKNLQEMYVKRTLSDNWVSDGASMFSPLQEKIFGIIASYKDLLFARRSFLNGEEIRKVYLLHALNHVLKSRSKIVKNNSKLRQASENNIEMEIPQDQGLTRPKVLILVPFREAALRTVNMLIDLLVPKGQGQVNNRKRFMEEFKEEEHLKSKVDKPESYEATFSGNIDDCFRVGISLKKKTVNLYTEFYSSDVIVASPLGIRTIIGAEGDKHRDYDFLSSLEMIIVDQADVYIMQNWEHVLHLFDHTHLQPTESHGVDFSRVRMWALNGWNKFYRQTLVFCDFLTPEINSLFGSHCKNFSGKVKVFEPYDKGTLSQTEVQVPHVFRKFPCSSHIALPSSRLQYFMEQVLPDFTGELKKRTAVIIPSYLDFIQIKSKMEDMELDYVSLNEYTKSADVSRTRTKFFRGNKHFLLYTERLHFFRRYRIRGIHHVIFYGLPSYAEFYPELVNLLREAPAGMTCTVMYSSFDSLALSRIVGSANARQMITSQDNLHTFYTK